jgi:hypothetical protein
LALLRAQVEPTPTAELSLHDVALEIGLTVNHSTYDTLYVAFALAMGAERVVVADGPFVTAMQTHPDPHPGRNTPAARRMGQRPERLKGVPSEGMPSVDNALRWITSLRRANNGESHAYRTPFPQ